RFWFILILVPVVTAGALFLLMTSVRADINQKREDIAKKLTKLNDESKKALQNANTVDLKTKEADEFKEAEKKAWITASQQLDGIMTWPEGFKNIFDFRNGLFATEITLLNEKAPDAKLPPDPKAEVKEENPFRGVIVKTDPNFISVQSAEKKVRRFYRTTKVNKLKDQKTFFNNLGMGQMVFVAYEKGKYFNDPLTEDEERTFSEHYHSQIDSILTQVQPMNEKGQGVVQLKGWFYDPNWLLKRESWPKPTDKFLTYVQRWTANNRISEEAWIAQEDLWIQREIFRIIRAANDAVSQFSADPKKPDTFTNPYWEFKLSLNGNQLNVLAKNLLDRRQKLDQDFSIAFHKTLPAEK